VSAKDGPNASGHICKRSHSLCEPVQIYHDRDIDIVTMMIESYPPDQTYLSHRLIAA